MDSGGSFDDVFTAYHGRLLKLACLITGDRGAGEDAVAEAFAKTFPQWKRGRLDDVSAYLRRAVVNECYAVFRRRRRREPVAETIVESAEDRILERERVWGALLELPFRQRAVLVLRHWEGLNEAETAAVLGMPVGTAKSTASRAMDRLRVVLAEEEVPT
jgi:RNA polymerase sigma-70 factor (sigma-E family)